jgi:hypothetical protein
MSRAFLPLMATVAGAIAVFYLVTEVLTISDGLGMVLGGLAALTLALGFARYKKKDEE